MYVPYRPLLFVSGLTVGDYLLWNWSLSGNRDVLSLVSGLTLPPLLAACAWLLVLTLARLLMSQPERRNARAVRASRRAETSHTSAPPHRTPAGRARTAGEPASSTAPAGRSSSKLAA
jgi:hypothetical protein